MMKAYTLSDKINSFLPYLNEKQKRIYLASESKQLGHGGIGIVSEISGINRNTITRGKVELEENSGSGVIDTGRVRKAGAGRKRITVTHPGIKEKLLSLVNDSSYGNPENPLMWTTKSLRNLSDSLRTEGINVCFKKVGQLLEELGFSLQQNQKMLQVGEEHHDRDVQFRHINETALMFIRDGNPVVSVDCKKKENVGNFKNNGAEYSEKYNPTEVLDHDFPLPELGKAVPYGVYDIAANEGYVNVGISSDTAEFAVSSLKLWWLNMGKTRYPDADRLYITADGGGSNGSRNRLWKSELQMFANETGLKVTVSHFPLGTSKWNKIEHRMFSQISKNWRGRPLETLEVIINLISSTTTKSGLAIKCGIDTKEYKTGQKISKEELASVNIERGDVCSSWNYTISPQ